MSMRHPNTVEEWRAYAAKLEGEDLRAKIISANSVAFVRQLKEEGVDAAAIHAIIAAFAARGREVGQVLPTGGFYDLDRLIESAPA